MNGSVPGDENVSHPIHNQFFRLQFPALDGRAYKELSAGLPEKSLGFLSKANPVRKIAIRISRCKYFERFILLAICANCVTLSMDSSRPGFTRTGLARALQPFDKCFQAIFTMEMVLKILAMGFVGEPGTYLRDGWNVLDFCVVVLAYLAYLPGIDNYTAVRTIRVLRPLRTITGVEGMRVLVVTLLKALPMLLDVMILCGFVFFIFGIVGVQLFAGSFRYRCLGASMGTAYTNTSTSIVHNVTYTLGSPTDDDICSGPSSSRAVWMNTTGTPVATRISTGSGHACPWRPPSDPTQSGTPWGQFCTPYSNPNNGITSFDNILWAWLTIFQCITGEGWTDVMYFSQDALTPWAWLYFVVLMVFGSMFLVNLALAVLYVQFVKERQEPEDEHEEDLLAEASQKSSESLSSLDSGADSTFGRTDSQGSSNTSSLGDMTAATSMNLQRAACRHSSQESSSGSYVNSSPDSPSVLRVLCARIERSPRFEYLTVGCIIINTILLALSWPHMPQALNDAEDVANYILTAYFALEMAIKLISRGPLGYIQDRMNIFDGIVVISSIVELGIDLAGSVSIAGGSLSVLRSFRILRVFKLARSWRELNKIINTMFKSVVSVGYLSLILLLFIFICALIGMQLFGFKYAFCDYVDGAQQLCPPGQDELHDCPSHFDCYIPCSESSIYSWIPAPGSSYGGMAFCERFPRPNKPAVGNVTYQYWAQVGKAVVDRPNFDNLFWSVLAVFQMLTGENWNNIMYNGMRATGALSAVFFVFVMVIGNYIFLNLFLAILLDNFGNDEGDGMSVKSTGKADKVLPEGPFPASGPGYIPAVAAAEKLSEEPIWSSYAAEGTIAAVGIDRVHSSSQHMFGGITGFGLVSPADSQREGSGLPDISGYSLAFNNYKRYQHQRAMSEAKKSDSPARAYLHQVLEGKALCVLHKDNPIRWRVAFAVNHRYFEYVVLSLIFASSISLALDYPALDPNSGLKHALDTMDVIFTCAFAIEAVMKIISYGFLFNGPSSYLRNGWNMLDFIVVAVGMVLLASSFGAATASKQLSSLRALRTLRALRPLRMASRAEGMKVVVNALFKAIPSLFNVLLVCMLFFLIFGIMGMNLLQGALRSCQDTDGNVIDAAAVLPAGQKLNALWCRQGVHTVNTSSYHHALPLPNGSVGVAVPDWTLETQWVKQMANFDNIITGIWSLFQISTTEMWVSYMLMGVDAVGLDQQPVRNQNPAIALFYMAFIVIGGFFALNLFVGVTIDKFNEMHRAEGQGSLLLTPQQEQWIAIQKMLADTTLETRYIAPEHPIRKAFFSVAMSNTFDAFIIAVILVNVAFLSMVHADMSIGWQDVMSYANLVFTGIFFVEMVLKMVAIGPLLYFKDPWNSFDFTVLMLSIASVIVDFASSASLGFMSLLRVLRVVRVFRLIPKAKGLRALLQTLFYSLPALGNVGSVTLLLFFIYSIVGMNLFGSIKYQQYLNRHANFNNVGIAMLTLLRMTTGENWNGIMQDCMITTSCIYVKQDLNTTDHQLNAGDYVSKAVYAKLKDSYGEHLQDQCSPSPLVAVVYFCSFVILCGFMLLNLVIAVILENMSKSSSNEQLAVNKSSIMQFVEAWAELDPLATNYIHVKDLSTLVSELDPPLGARGEECTRAKVQAIIMAVDIPNRGNKVHFAETLHALSGRVAGTELPEDEETKVHDKILSRLPSSINDIKYTAAHFYAAMYVQAAIRGYLARHQMTGVITSLSHRKTAAAAAAAATAAAASGAALPHES